MNKPVILIPVYNHEVGIVRVVNAILELGLPCILVNDGSTASCTAVLTKLQADHPDLIHLFQHTVNQGKGAAITTGLKAALNLGYTHALQVDADGQHNLNDISTFLKCSEKNPDALICGYPVYDSSVPKHRYYSRYLTHIWVWINTISLRIKDSMCGFRVYPVKPSVEIISKQHLFSRMSFDIEVLVRTDWAGVPIINCPTKVHYPEDGVSHFLAVKDNVLISLMHTRLFFGMLLRSPKLIWRCFSDPAKYLKP